MDKVLASPLEAVADIRSGASLAVGGFGLCGIPSTLIAAVLASGIDELELVSNNCGVDDWGLGLLLTRQYLAGELEVELTPQGTLAERLRAAGAGIPAFYTATGAGTLIAGGGLPWRYHPDGTVAIASPPKPTSRFETAGHDFEFVLETALICDYALVRAFKGDRHGNLVFHSSARNFNPLCAMAGRITIAEVEELVDVGDIHPDDVHLPGVYVHRVVALQPEQAADKRIERLTTGAGAAAP